MLNDLQRMVAELKDTSSANNKKKILARYPQCKTLLNYTYNPEYNYFVSSKNILKQEKILSTFSGPNLFGNTSKGNALSVGKAYTTLESLLDDLNDGIISGLAAIKAILTFMRRRENLPYRDLILNVIDRDLKCRISESLINKVWPGLIPVTKVALAEKYFEVEDSVDFEKDTWLASRKLDGVRTLTVIDENGKIKCLSRKGKEFDTLQRVKDELKTLFPDLKGVVFDGETCIVDDEGTEHFSDVMKVISRKDYTIPFPRYKLFDILTLEEFNTQTSTSTFSERYAKLKKLIPRTTSSILDVIDQIKVRDKKHLDTLFAEAQAKGWEGLILRKDVEYKGKRSFDLLKVKAFFDGEYRVIRMDVGPFQVVVNGKEVTEEMMTRVFISHKGNEVGVGSGFTLEERREFYKHPDRIIGKMVTVQYFEETTNQKDSSISLRFPTIKAIYDSVRDI